MSPRSILITQCLQNDFVKPIDIHEPLPNLLHIGFEESKRLMGESPKDSMLINLMNWAYKRSKSDLEIINIRDWHDPNDPKQKAHLELFGDHCLQNTLGAEFVFESSRKKERDLIVDSIGLNDFVETSLYDHLSSYNKSTKIGLIGVWTEAKILFLAYELATKYPHFEIVVCSALTASSSTHMHFLSLDQISKILNVRVLSSVNEFASYLSTDNVSSLQNIGSDQSRSERFSFEKDTSLNSEQKLLLNYMFRNSKSVNFKVLDGGFSGNLVLKASGKDIHGHEEVPTVVKVGNRNLMAKERDSFEKIKNILGNNAPQIVDYAENETLAGIKYRYASMSDENVITLQKFYVNGADESKIFHYLDIIFNQQLGRFYKAASKERIDLFHYYDFSTKYLNSINENIRNIVGDAFSEELDYIEIENVKSYNLLDFYKNALPKKDPKIQYSHYLSYIHGDLNGANIIIDGHENVWLIDFFHTHRGHILKDLIKFENDLLYIFTPINSKEEFEEGCSLIKAITDIEDLWNPLNQVKLQSPQFIKAYNTIKHLRGFYKNLVQTDRDPLQLFLGMLRYSVHNLSFEESSLWQKKLALFTSCHLAYKIKNRILSSNALRFDNLLRDRNNIALTVLPGRKDRGRNLKDDILQIKKAGFDVVVSLLANDEYRSYGVPDLLDQYSSNGLNVLSLNIIDQGVPSNDDMNELINEIHSLVNNNKKILIHCVGGLGRTGVVAACYLIKYDSYSTIKAIEHVRQVRSKRAIESKLQEEFVKNFIQ